MTCGQATRPNTKKKFSKTNATRIKKKKRAKQFLVTCNKNFSSPNWIAKHELAKFLKMYRCNSPWSYIYKCTFAFVIWPP